VCAKKEKKKERSPHQIKATKQTFAMRRNSKVNTNFIRQFHRGCFTDGMNEMRNNCLAFYNMGNGVSQESMDKVRAVSFVSPT
jgi:hypothetical protein